MSFCHQFVETATTYQDRLAMVLLGDAENYEITYGEMLAAVRAQATRLRRNGIGPGDRVVIFGENHPHWAIAYIAILYAGAVVVPLDPASPDDVLGRFISDAEAKFAYSSVAAAEKLQSVCTQIGRSIPIVTLDDGGDQRVDQPWLSWSASGAATDTESLGPSAKDEDLALLIYTSGTTGQPKAVPLTHRNIHAQYTALQEIVQLGHTTVVLSLLPLLHAYSQIVNLWVASTVGARVVYLLQVNAAEIERALKRQGITALVGVPRLWYLFHKKIFSTVSGRGWPVRWLFRTLLALNGWLRSWFSVNAGRVFFAKVHREFGGKLEHAVTAGAMFDPEVARDFDRLGFNILQGYGLTETSGAATLTRANANMVGSVGTPVRDVEVKIDGPNGQGIGEVLIRGPVVMDGYWRNPEANREAFTPDRWFRSGDLGRFDERGHLFIVGRKKDVIVLSSGKNVYPEDVEAQYDKSPLISEICVLGNARDGDPAGVDELCAVIVPDFDYLKSQQIPNAREAIRFALDGLSRGLPEYQRVHRYLIRAEPLPRTATRKVRRFELSSQIQGNGLARIEAPELLPAVLTAVDSAVMDSPAGRAVTRSLRERSPTLDVINPAQSLEFDLGLDSLARVELVASVEHALGITFEANAIAAAITVGELVDLAKATAEARGSGQGKVTVGTQRQTDSPAPRALDWHEILNRPVDDAARADRSFATRPVIALFALFVLRSVYLVARLLLRLEVRGIDRVKQLSPPFLICPNHQSFLDPILVSSLFPHRVLKSIFHLGASEYYQNFLTISLARLANIVLVDQDRSLRKAMQLGAAGLRAGRILTVYPEGERTFDGKLHEFKKGSSILACETGVPIVPVALDGVYKVWPRNSWRLRPAKVKIWFGEPIYPEALAAQESDRELAYQSTNRELRSSIERMLEAMRT